MEKEEGNFEVHFPWTPQASSKGLPAFTFAYSPVDCIDICNPPTSSSVPPSEHPGARQTPKIIIKIETKITFSLLYQGKKMRSIALLNSN